jgi:hypothetical protein
MFLFYKIQGFYVKILCFPVPTVISFLFFVIVYRVYNILDQE